MKVFYGVIFLLAFIIIDTIGLKSSNAFYKSDKSRGEVTYLTPAPAPEAAVDTTAKAETAKEAPKAEGEKAAEGEKK
jgi:hypothetical protein